MNASQAKSIILVAVVVSALLASIGEITQTQAQATKAGTTFHNGVPDLKIGVGAFVLAIFLLTLAEVTPQLAASFGLLVLVSALFAVGPDVYNTIAKATSPAKVTDTSNNLNFMGPVLKRSA